MESERKEFEFKTWAMQHGLKRGTVYVLEKEHCCSEDNLRRLSNMEIDQLDISKAQKQVLGRAINELAEGAGFQGEAFEFSDGRFAIEVDSSTEEPEEQEKPVEIEEKQDEPVEPEDHDEEPDEGKEICPDEPEQDNVTIETTSPIDAVPHQDALIQKLPQKKAKNKGRFSYFVILIFVLRICISS